MAILLVVGIVSPMLRAQLPLDPLTPGEQERARTVLLSNADVQQNLANTARYRIMHIVRHEEDKAIQGTAERRADVLLYNYTTDQAVSAVVRLGDTPQVDAMQILNNVEPPVTPEEVAEAKQLALADPGVQARLRAAGLTEDATKSLIVLDLPAAALDQGDACSTHRCVALFFVKPGVILNVNPVVDLSAQRVHCQ
jgi:Cu2+-containing amine oxidase